jgi:uncharacterized protein
MIELTEIARLASQIVAIAKPEKVILFGSYAYGTPAEDSDLDIMVILPFEGHWAYQAAAIRQQLPFSGFSIDLLLRTPQQIADRLAIGDPFVNEIIEQGRLLYCDELALMTPVLS